jgi:lysozyme
MYSFLGPHINRTTGAVVQLTQAWHPPVATVLDPDSGWVPIAQGLRTKFVWRLFRPVQPDWNDPATDPEQEAKRWLAESLKRILALAGAGGYWQGDNEPVIESAAAMARYAAYEVARMKLLRTYGLSAAIGGFAVGNPKNLSWWGEFLPAFQEGVGQGAVLILHEYNWPGLEGDGAHDPAWLSLRHRLVYGGEPTHRWVGIPTRHRLPVIITETGSDRIFGAEEAGWKGLMGNEEYLRSLEWYSRELAKDSYVLGACVYCVNAESAQWVPYDIHPDVSRAMMDVAVPAYRGFPSEPDQVLGVDVSRWQGKVDWARVAAAGYAFAVLRCSVGEHIDTTFGANLKGCLEYGVQPMAYHFLKRGNVPDQVVTAYKALWSWKHLRLWVDLERDAISGTFPGQDDFALFVSEMQVPMNLPIGCYTSAYMVQTVGFSPWEIQGLGKMPLWVADWNRNYVRKPRLPRKAPRWHIQQTTSSGSVPGISGRVDLDVWNGNLRTLNSFCKG